MKGQSLVTRFEEKYLPVSDSGCWLWISSRTSTGYGLFWHNKRYELAHRFSYIYYKGIIPDTTCVCHKCDIPECVNPDHLFLGTHKDNTKDMWRKGRAKGWKNTQFKANNAGHRKLSDTDVLEIRDLLKSNLFTQTEIGRFYNICKQQICRIKHNQSWKFVC